MPRVSCYNRSVRSPIASRELFYNADIASGSRCWRPHRSQVPALGLSDFIGGFMETKQCSGCGMIKPLTEFYRDRRLKSGRCSQCKSCKNQKTGTCSDCGKPVNCHAARCQPCSARFRWTRGDYGNEETRQRFSEAVKQRWDNGSMDDPERYEKISKAMKRHHARGVFDTEEVRWKMSSGVRAAHARGVYSNDKARANKSRALRARWERGEFDTDEMHRKFSDGKRANWVAGIYDGVFISPSKPEQAIAQVLDDLGIEYQTQYRLEGDSRPFDFLIGDTLLLEVDGVYWHGRPGAAERDAAKTALAKRHGYRLVRVTDMEIGECGAAAIIDSIGELI